MSQQFRVPEIEVKVLGVKFQAFVDPETKQPVFSQSGAARALQISERTVRRILVSDEFRSLRGKGLQRGTLHTTVNPNPISVVTQADLVLLVQIAADRGFSIARSMQEASFAVLLQQSVDEALNVNRERREYLEAGATLRQKLEYRYSYHAMKDSTLQRGHGVRGLCKINRQVSSLAVADANERRQADKGWRRKCTAVETVKITIGNTVHQRAVEASNQLTADANLREAALRTSAICVLLDKPF